MRMVRRYDDRRTSRARDYHFKDTKKEGLGGRWGNENGG